jgi:hypothetical protein
MKMALVREYFYKDPKGEIQPYHYCSECWKQYTNDEFNAGLIVNVGSTATPIKYCAKPCLGLKFTDYLSNPLGASYPTGGKLPTEEPMDIRKVPEKKPKPVIQPIIEPKVEELPIQEILIELKVEEPPQEIPPQEEEPVPFSEELERLSGRQIVEKVKKEKGIEITCSLKSKKVIIKRAMAIYGF